MELSPSVPQLPLLYNGQAVKGLEADFPRVVSGSPSYSQPTLCSPDMKPPLGQYVQTQPS